MLNSKQKALALADISQNPTFQPQRGSLNLAARSLLAGGEYSIKLIFI